MPSKIKSVSELIASPWVRLLAELHDSIVDTTTTFWRGRNGCSVLLPITTAAVSSPMGRGSDSSPVRVSIGGFDVYLADSMQFYLEVGVRITGKPVYYLMPSFRGEIADETHLPQFFHSVVEIDGGLNDIIETAESYLRALVASIRSRCAESLNNVAAGVVHLDDFLSQPTYRRLTFNEAVNLVPSQVILHDGWRSISRAGEAELLRIIGGPLWITHFDHLAVPFYQGFSDTTHRQATNADFLLGSGEVIGAGERHTTYTDVQTALIMHDVDPSTYDWYLEMKRTFPRRTAGFGVGLERLLMWVLQVPDIRQVQLIPRDSHETRIL